MADHHVIKRLVPRHGLLQIRQGSVSFTEQIDADFGCDADVRIILGKGMMTAPRLQGVIDNIQFQRAKCSFEKRCHQYSLSTTQSDVRGRAKKSRICAENFEDFKFQLLNNDLIDHPSAHVAHGDLSARGTKVPSFSSHFILNRHKPVFPCPLKKQGSLPS